jgi:O-antigen/teichoic acid export membrane protein
MTSDSSGNSKALRRNALANVIGRIVTAVLWVAVTPLVLGRLGADRFGVWSIFFALIASAAVLDLGVSNIAGRFVALGRGSQDLGMVRAAIRRAVAAGVVFGLIWSVVCVLARGPIMQLFGVAPEMRAEVGAALLALATSLALFAPAQALQGVLVGFQRLDLANLSQVSGVVLHVAALAATLLAGHGLVGAAMAGVLGQAIALTTAGIAVLLLVRRLPAGNARSSVSWRQMLSFGATVQVTNAFISGQQNTPRFLLGALGSLGLVAQFELGARVATAMWSIPTLILGAVIPAAARASADPGSGGLRTVYEWACRWVFASSAFLLGGLWLTAPGLFVLWLGPGHGPSADLARGLVFALAAATMAGPATAVARGGGWPAFETVTLGGALLLNLALSGFLIPRSGASGAVLALGLSYAVTSVALIEVFRRRIGVSASWWTRLPMPRYGAGAACVAAVWLLTRNMPVGTQMESGLTVGIQGAAFTLLFAAVGWFTGDSQLVWNRAIERWRSMRGGRDHGG